MTRRWSRKIEFGEPSGTGKPALTRTEGLCIGPLQGDRRASQLGSSTVQTGERRIDWYSDQLPTTCEGWQQDIRGRYQAIGRNLRPDRLGVRRLNVLGRRARPVALPGMGLIDGRTYDLVVLCTGNRETAIDGLDFGSFDEYAIPDTNVVARQHYNLSAFRVGPHARLPFTRQEREDGVADIPVNAVSMFRTPNKTAALAATLPAVTRD